MHQSQKYDKITTQKNDIITTQEIHNIIKGTQSDFSFFFFFFQSSGDFGITRKLKFLS